VLRYASDLLDPVRSGAMSLNKAYEEARIRKGQADTSVDIRTFLSYSDRREREAIHQAAESPRCQDHQKRGKGGHVLAEHAGRQAPIPTHGDEDLSPVFIKKICKQLRIDPNEIL
jgi:hypothetical protein